MNLEHVWSFGKKGADTKENTHKKESKIKSINLNKPSKECLPKWRKPNEVF